MREIKLILNDIEKLSNNFKTDELLQDDYTKVKKNIDEFEMLYGCIFDLCKRANVSNLKNKSETILILIYIRSILITMCEILEEIDEFILKTHRVYRKMVPEEKWKEYE